MTTGSPSSLMALLERIKPENVLHFPEGIPGFPEEKRFCILQSEEDKPLAWLQSLKTPDLAFVVTSPFILFPDYRPDVPDDELMAIGSPVLNDVLVLSIVRVIPANPPELRTNLKAPIIINTRTFSARQVILINESMYSENAVYRVKS